MGTPEAELSELARRYGGTHESYREESPRGRGRLRHRREPVRGVRNELTGFRLAESL